MRIEGQLAPLDQADCDQCSGSHEEVLVEKGKDVSGGDDRVGLIRAVLSKNREEVRRSHVFGVSVETETDEPEDKEGQEGSNADDESVHRDGHCSGTFR